MPSDDLSSLFAPNPKGPALPASFRQAVLLSFDANDGTNTVGIGASELPNLPLLVTGAEIGLESGDNILVMYLGNSAMIVGKIATPGSANYGATLNGRFSRDGFVDNASGFAVAASPTGTTVITETRIVVPSWANSCLLIMFGQAQMGNTSGALRALSSQVKMTCPGVIDNFSGSVATSVPNNTEDATFALFAERTDVTPGATLTFTYTLFGGAGAWPTDAGSIATMTAQLQYFRETAFE
jgi:hypothetical protein